MNYVINYKSYNIFKYSLILFFASIVLNSCKDNDLEIEQNFPFNVNVMPVPSKIKENETVEIRISLETESHYSGTKYYIRYFQYEGNGKLQYNSDTPYLPNDEYLLPNKQFRLYYTSESTGSQQFSIWIKDSFGNKKQIDFEFDHSD
ncbi:TraQ conjugal transfer family protein [Chryseobacterium fluminis]|uniref:DUF3872 domain-containing protein n=1 Tax=Chryseobacterium fluminis TaxID=2983606 RepID=UPI00224EAB81|nr:DUF3872 domain-containing protein [Chryseobacterium sp. MMS21-Ot14]UZT98044.1 TraQ conjugal transfer family protein [Chryseobacterium sp. MMS21-Ot14]